MRPIAECIEVASALLDQVADMPRPTQEAVDRGLAQIRPDWSGLDRADVLKLCAFISDRDVARSFFGAAPEFLVNARREFVQKIAAADAFSAARNSRVPDHEREHYAQATRRASARLQDIFGPALRGDQPTPNKDENQ